MRLLLIILLLLKNQKTLPISYVRTLSNTLKNQQASRKENRMKVTKRSTILAIVTVLATACSTEPTERTRTGGETLNVDDTWDSFFLVGDEG